MIFTGFEIDVNKSLSEIGTDSITIKFLFDGRDIHKIVNVAFFHPRVIVYVLKNINKHLKNPNISFSYPTLKNTFYIEKQKYLLETANTNDEIELYKLLFGDSTPNLL